jgi:hypothetical protein
MKSPSIYSISEILALKNIMRRGFKILAVSVFTGIAGLRNKVVFLFASDRIREDRSMLKYRIYLIEFIRPSTDTAF